MLLTECGNPRPIRHDSTESPSHCDKDMHALKVDLFLTPQEGQRCDDNDKDGVSLKKTIARVVRGLGSVETGGNVLLGRFVCGCQNNEKRFCTGLRLAIAMS